MHASLSLNGDGNAQGTHMSMYSAVLKGAYDTILSWSFNIPMIFCLIDHTDQNHNIIDKFYSNPILSSFQRPKVRDDEIFIKIRITLT
ncbi:unnamed protein product, partial [Rotaria sp. Silwood2]